MEEIKEFLKALFPNGINADTVSNICVAAYAIFQTINNSIFRKHAVTTDIQTTNTDKNVTELKDQVDKLTNCLQVLSSMIITTYLSANTISEATKKKLATLSGDLDKIAGIELDPIVEKMVEEVAKYDPQSTIVEKKEELVEKANEAEKVIDETNDVAQNIINQLTV